MSKKEIKHIKFDEIKNPDFLKDLSYEELDVLSEDIRQYILKTTSTYGGHLSSNLGAVESTISLCRNFNFLKDKIIFDVGHQCYTYKVLTGRSLEGLRTKDGPAGFQKMSESIYDHFEAGHSSTSISVANGMAIARDLNKEKYDVIAYIGDASIVNGLALEGLNLAAQNHHKIIIVFNDNNMSIGEPVGALSKAFRRISTSKFYSKTKKAFNKIFTRRFVNFLTSIKNWFKRHLIALNIFDLLGYKVIGPIDGHDIKAMDRAFAKAKRMNDSVVVHIKTVKGRGYPYAEEDKIGAWHGVGAFDIETGEALASKDAVSWSKYYEEVLMNVMDNHDDTVTIVPATGLGSYIDLIFKKYPERTIDVGISEEHAVTMSAGLAVSGKHPIISIYSTFLQRSYDEILHDLARMNTSVTFLVDRSGLTGNDGETHQGIYDEAFLYSIPNTVITFAATKEEAKYLLDESFNHKSPFFIRYPKENILKEQYSWNKGYEFGKWLLVKEAKEKKKAVVTLGPIIHYLIYKVNKMNIDVTIVNALFQNPMDLEMINSLLDYKEIIIYNAYATKQGFVNNLEAKLLELGYKGKIIVRAVENEYVAKASIDEQRQYYKLDIPSIIELIK